MPLSTVIQIAQNSLSNMTRRTGVLARNINEAGNEAYARRELQTITSVGGAQTSDIRRITDSRLERAANDTLSSNAAQQLMTQRLDTLGGLLAGDGPGLAVAERLAALHDSLQTYSGDPGNTVLGQAALDRAQEVVVSLRDATTDLQQFRSDVDHDIASAVADLKTLLIDFKEANNTIKQGTQTGADVNDAMDRRGAILNDIAKILPVSSFVRSNNDMVLMTTSGATLFETEPRNVSFAPQTAMAPGSNGGAVFVDIVKLKSGNGANSSASGTLDALFRLRDSVAPAIQSQMDEFARALVANFSEQDVTGGTLAPMQGLFSWSGGPAFPSAGTLTDGLAADISINPAYDPAQGGSVTRLRDGGANGAAYLVNRTGGASFADHLIALSTRFDTPQPFNAATGLGSSASILQFASQSSGYMASARSNANQSAMNAEAKYAVLRENLANVSGVNIDSEMAKLGELEQGYEASARLLRAADQMLQDLLDAVG